MSSFRKFLSDMRLIDGSLIGGRQMVGPWKWNVHESRIRCPARFAKFLYFKLGKHVFESDPDPRTFHVVLVPVVLTCNSMVFSFVFIHHSVS